MVTYTLRTAKKKASNYMRQKLIGGIFISLVVLLYLDTSVILNEEILPSEMLGHSNLNSSSQPDTTDVYKLISKDQNRPSSQ